MSSESGSERPRRKKRGKLQKWLNSTSRRIFLLLPIGLIAAEALIQQGMPVLSPWGLPFLVWGYVQCRLSVAYRNRLGGGGPGRDVPPNRIVDTGIYRFVRNPIYLGHLIFVLGLALTLQSWLAYGVLATLAIWYDIRVRADEQNLARLFGESYLAYRSLARRWIPYLY